MKVNDIEQGGNRTIRPGLYECNFEFFLSTYDDLGTTIPPRPAAHHCPTITPLLRCFVEMRIRNQTDASVTYRVALSDPSGRWEGMSETFSGEMDIRNGRNFPYQNDPDSRLRLGSVFLDSDGEPVMDQHLYLAADARFEGHRCYIIGVKIPESAPPFYSRIKLNRIGS